MGFRETFTRSENENVLGYDDSASLYFAGCMLLCILLPWTFSFVKRLIWPSTEKQDSKNLRMKRCVCTACESLRLQYKARSSSWSMIIRPMFLLELSVLILLWMWFVNITIQLSQTLSIERFDPFEILGVTSTSPLKTIRRAYHTLSLRHHPDKAKDDPDSAARFILISKAYQSLTDETARANFEKYGNPDGPGVMKIGIGLPHFLIAKEYRLFILLAFFAVLLGVIPGIFVLYYQRQKKFAPNGLMFETVQLLAPMMKEQSRQRQLSELLAASGESRELTSIRPSDNLEMSAIVDAVDDTGGKRLFANLPIVVRNHLLILAHLQRLHNLFSPALRTDLNTILERSDLITDCMAEIAYHREWPLTLQAAVYLRRCLVQALDTPTPASSLLQIPHLDRNNIRHCLKGKNAVKDLREFVLKDSDERKGLADMTEEQKKDVAVFCSHVPLMEISAKVEVVGEDDIVEGDIVSVTVQMTRTNLKEGERAGPVHAPYFPKEKFEEWWIYLIDKSTGSFISYVRSQKQERQFEETQQYQASRKGKQTLLITAYCDSYSGLDVSTEITIHVLSEDDADRHVSMHPDDEALDSRPTLFQQMLGSVTNQTEGDSTDGEDDKDETQ